MKFLALICALVLCACASVEKEPVTVPVEVKVPVTIPCIEPHEVPIPPNFATLQIQGHETDCELVNILLTDWVQRKTYIEQLQGVLAGCVKPAGSYPDK